MIEWGINALNHGWSLAVFDQGEFKNCTVGRDGDRIPRDIIQNALTYTGAPDRIFWYENPWIKKARQIRAGQFDSAFSLDNLPKHYLKESGLGYAPITYTPHHASHAAAGYYTSPFNHCAIVVIDAIGEFDCASIWEGMHGEMRKVWSSRYPNSLGLYYSAFTQLLGLTPIRDEGVLEQMAALGDPRKYRSTIDKYFGAGDPITLDYNFHRGVLDWDITGMPVEDQCNLAASVQERFEIEIARVMFKAKQLTNADSLVYMGGCAFNKTANKNEVERQFKYIWSLADPGDASSAIGAVAYHRKHRIWRDNWAPVKHIEIRI